MAPLQWTKYMDFASYVTYWCLSIFIENMKRKAHEAHNIPHKWDLEDPPSARDLIRSELGDWARGSPSFNDCLQLLDNYISWTDFLCQMWIASLLKCFPTFLRTDIRQKSFSTNADFLELKLLLILFQTTKLTCHRIQYINSHKNTRTIIHLAPPSLLDLHLGKEVNISHINLMFLLCSFISTRLRYMKNLICKIYVLK